MVWFLIILTFILGVSALISGGMLLLVPDGSLMRMPTAILSGSIFTDFLIPGLILFVFLGVYPMLVGLGLWKMIWTAPGRFNPFKSYHWSWTASLATGIILLIWILTETLMLGYVSFLQPVMALWGILVIILTLLPAARRHYRRV